MGVMVQQRLARALKETLEEATEPLQPLTL